MAPQVTLLFENIFHVFEQLKPFAINQYFSEYFCNVESLMCVSKYYTISLVLFTLFACHYLCTAAILSLSLYLHLLQAIGHIT